MIQLLFCTSFRFTTLTKDQAGNLNSSLLFLYLYYHGDFCHQNWNYQLQGWIMKQDRIYFAFPSKSEEPAKLLVLVININTLQVTFKDQEDIQNCLRCCTPGAELRSHLQETIFGHFPLLLQITSVPVTLLPPSTGWQYSVQILHTRKNAGRENQCLFSHVWWENAGAKCFPAWQVVPHEPQLFSLLKHRPQFWPCRMV